MDDVADRLRRLRLEVGTFRRSERRRVFASALHAGILAGRRESCVLDAEALPVLDHALRVDLVSRLLAGVATAAATTVWLTRPGGVETRSDDLAWLGAADVALGELGRAAPDFYVITRSGWSHPRTGGERVWKRLRL